jgi:hypothetical protein
MSLEKPKSREIEQDRERVFKRLIAIINAQYKMHQNTQRYDSVKFDFDKGDFVTGAEETERDQKQLRKYIQKMEEVELDGLKFKIMGWSVNKKNAGKDNSEARITTMLESEVLDDLDYPPNSEEGKLFYNKFGIWFSKYPNSFISNSKMDSTSPEPRLYIPMAFEGEYPDVIDKAREITGIDKSSTGSK